MQQQLSFWIKIPRNGQPSEHAQQKYKNYFPGKNFEIKTNYDIYENLDVSQAPYLDENLHVSMIEVDTMGK